VTSLSDVTIWVAIGLIGIGTFVLRFSFIGLLGRVEQVPPLAERALRLVPAAVFAALVGPALLRSERAFDPFDARVAAGAAAALVAWWTKSVVATLVTGMVALWGLNAL
jgi:branched-subunit amino acid transport protein